MKSRHATLGSCHTLLLAALRYAILVIAFNQLELGKAWSQNSTMSVVSPVGTLVYSYDAKLQDGSVTVSVRPPDLQRGESQTVLQLKDGATISQVEFPEDLGSVSSISRVGISKYLVIETSTAPYSGVFLFDASSRRFVEDFPCYNPTLSPNHRFLAFSRMFPSHFVQRDIQSSDFEMIYDFSKDVDYNHDQRIVGRHTSKPEGHLLYPGSFQELYYDKKRVIPVIHERRGKVIFSDDSKRLVFLESTFPSAWFAGRETDGNAMITSDIPLRSSLTFVMIDLAGDRPISRYFDTSLCDTASGDDCGVSLADAAFTNDSVQFVLSRKFLGKSDLKVAYRNFEPVR